MKKITILSMDILMFCMGQAQALPNMFLRMLFRAFHRNALLQGKRDFELEAALRAFRDAQEKQMSKLKATLLEKIKKGREAMGMEISMLKAQVQSEDKQAIIPRDNRDILSDFTGKKY